MSAPREMLPSERFKALMADPALRERFLPPMTAEEIAAVERLLDPVVEEVEAWCRTHSAIVDPVMAVPISLLAIVEFPQLPPERTATMVKMILWVYAFDDFVDVPHRGVAEIGRIANECFFVAALPQSRTERETAYADALFTVMQDLSDWRMFATSHALWMTCFSRLIDAIVIQGKAAPLRLYASAIPTIEDYMYFSNHGIGFPLLSVTGIIGTDSVELIESIPRLMGLFERCAGMIRLANDLRSYEHELVDGSLNALAMAATGAIAPVDSREENSAERARRELHRRIAGLRASALSLTQPLSDVNPMGERAIRTADIAVYMFKKGDLRTWPTYR